MITQAGWNAAISAKVQDLETRVWIGTCQFEDEKPVVKRNGDVIEIIGLGLVKCCLPVYIKLFYFDANKRTNKMVLYFDLPQKLYVNICIFENHHLLRTNGINMD